MDKLLLSDWATLIATLGVLVALIGNLYTFREKGQSQAAQYAEMRSDIKHIREIVEGITAMKERIVSLEENVKQAQRRLDRMEEKSE